MSAANPHGRTAWWAEPVETVASRLGTDPVSGLTAEEASLRLEASGPNVLEQEPTQPPIKIFFAQFANTMIVVLLVAAVVMVSIGEPTDAVVIGAIVILNAVIGFVQEYRAEQAMEALRTMTAPNARVVRDNVEATVAAVDMVPGDVVVLESGDIVAADVRLLDCPNLRTDESALTGESVPVDKTDEVLAEDAGEMIGDRSNMAFKGTSVAYGRGRGIVVATGMDTALGQIAGLLQTHAAPPTPLQRKLAVLGRRLAAAAIVVCAVVFVVGVARGEEVETMFLTSVSLAVAAIPEALPAVVTIGLALGAQRMIRHHTLVRRLPAVETLGSVTVICTDKTGTLTQGRMMVERVWTPEGEFEVTGSGYEPTGDILPARDSASLGELLRAAALCNDAVLVAPTEADGDWDVAGDPTEGALLAVAAKAGFERGRLNEAHPRIGEIPFDSNRKWMLTIHGASDPTEALVAAKGAAEAIVDSCESFIGSGGRTDMTDDFRATALEAAHGLAAEGYRVLAVAGAHTRREAVGSTDLHEAKPALEFYGFVGMADPPRAESMSAVAACRAAGITPVMITGDHPATGQSIGRRLGILDADEQVMTGVELASEDATGLATHVASVAVYARTSPEQKLDIVEAWKDSGAIVAMTGDGVNDAPALRSADIGVAMGLAGTEVAKEAADMVLADDNFASIVTAVGEGRRIYDNIRRFVRYTLTSNAGEIWVMFLGPFLGLPLPLQPVQILWINLVTDGVPGLALGVEPAEPDVMKRPPRPPDESIFARGLWQHVMVVGLTMGALTLGLGLWAESDGRPWQTMVFTTLALLQLGHALAVRSDRQSLFSQGLMSNRLLLGTVVVTLALQLVIIYWPPLQDLLKTEALSTLELGLVLLVSTGVFWVVELEKLVRRRLSETGQTADTAGRF